MGQVSIGDQKVGSKLIVLLLVVGFIGFAWQAVRPLVFNTDMYDFNSVLHRCIRNSERT